MSAISPYYNNQIFNPALLIEPDFSDCPFPDFSFDYDVGATDFFSGFSGIDVPDIPKNNRLVKTCEISSQNMQAIDLQEGFSDGEFSFGVGYDDDLLDYSGMDTGGFSFGDSVDIAELKPATIPDLLAPKISDMGKYAFDKFFGFTPEPEKNAVLRVKKSVNFAILGVLKRSAKVPRFEDMKFLDFVDKKTVSAYDDLTGAVINFTVKGYGENKKYIPKKSAADHLIDRFSLQRVMAAILPKYRVSKCLHTVQNNSFELGVYQSTAHKTISVSNLQTCGSVWHCPVCAAKITEQRRIEMDVAITAHKLQGGSVVFVTRTTPHYKTDSLFDIRTKFAKADLYLKNHRDYRNLLKSHNISDSIKAKELTVSDANGWHLHVHEIYFVDQGAFTGEANSNNPEYVAFLETLRAGLYARWKLAAVKAGFEEPSEKYGLQVQNGDFAADYVAKWGLEPEGGCWSASAELSKAHVKNSKKGYTPWSLIRLYDETRDPALIPIIQEYAEAMHGQRQLVWSRGLKKRFEIEEKDDDAIVEEKEDDAVKIGFLSPEQWVFIVKNNIRTDFFILARSGWQVITDFLYSFEDYPRVFSLEPS